MRLCGLQGSRARSGHTSCPSLSLWSILATMVVAAQCSFSDFLDVSVPAPEFLPGEVNVTVREGDSAVLPCSVRHLGTKQVAWRRVEGDNFLTIGTMTWAADNNVSLNHTRKSGQVTTWDLVIQHARPQDAGLYECQVTSRVGHVRLVQLNVVGPPITKSESWQHVSIQDTPATNPPVRFCGASDLTGCLISITGRKFLEVGDRMHLVCNASGGARIPDEIDWFKGGDKIDSTKYRHVVLDKYQSMADRSFISELTIERSTPTDSGDYICRSSRNDIANLKVTVLNAQSDNKRRGTGPGPLMSSNESEDVNAGQRFQRDPACLLIVLVWTAVWCLTRCPSS